MSFAAPKSFSKSEPNRLHGRLGSIMVVASIVAVIIASQVYKQEIVDFGNAMLVRFHKHSLYALLFVIAAISSTLVPLPVWIYVFTGVALGFHYMECSVVIGLGSSLGSASTYALGRYFRHTDFFAKRFSEANLEKWQQRSRLRFGIILFFGTISPVPMDAFYAIAGVIQFPTLPFLSVVTSARLIRYVSMGYLFFVMQLS